MRMYGLGLEMIFMGLRNGDERAADQNQSLLLRPRSTVCVSKTPPFLGGCIDGFRIFTRLGGSRQLPVPEGVTINISHGWSQFKVCSGGR